MAGNYLKAVIPAAGKGVRLAKLTRKYPKPMLKFNGKPLLEHILNSIKEVGIKDVIIVVGYMGEQIIKYFSDGSKFNLNITYVFDKKVSGTATAIKAAEDKVESTFLMVFGDVYPEPELLKSLIEKHINAKAKLGTKLAATLAITEVDDPFNHAPILFKDDKVLEIWSNKSSWVDMGIMVLEPIIFKAIEYTPLIRGEFRILKSIEIAMKWGYKVIVHKSTSPWVQIGDHRGVMSLIETNNYFLQKAGLNNYLEDSIIVNSQLSKTSVIKSMIINSKLNNCIVYEGVKIISSVLENCVVDEGVHLNNMKEKEKIITI